MAIIFWDFDGTLAYSNPLWSNTVYNSLKEVEPNTNVAFNEIRKCMASAHGNRADPKGFFIAGYHEMLKRIEHETIICYHYLFPEMEGNIFYRL